VPDRSHPGAKGVDELDVRSAVLPVRSIMSQRHCWHTRGASDADIDTAMSGNLCRCAPISASRRRSPRRATEIRPLMSLDRRDSQEFHYLNGAW